jgi:hypothetical protein
VGTLRFALLVQRKFVPRTSLAYAGLLASLLLGYFSARNHDLIAVSSPLASLIVNCVLLTVPLFFSGIVFSTLIGKPKINVSTALAYNLMGALFGGLMEYNSMYFGFAFLYLLAIGFYFLAFVFSFEPSAVLARRPGWVERSDTHRLVASIDGFRECSGHPTTVSTSSCRPCRRTRCRPRGRPPPSRS